MQADVPSDGTRRFGDLKLRVLSGVAAAVLGGVLLWLGGVWAMALIALVTGAMIWEFRAMTLTVDGVSGRTDVPILIGAVIGAVIVSHFYGIQVGARWLLWSLVIGAFADLLVKRRRAMSWGLVGGTLIGAAGIALLYLRGLDTLGFETALWVLLVVIGADIGGYFAGRIFGGPKLWPRVSPNKTWSGALGGIVLASLLGAAVSAGIEGSNLALVVAISALVAVIAQAGDLAESAVKRHFGVKDSGVLMPGHGGALDRFDGLITAALAVAAVVWFHGDTILLW
ncbi:MAG: phosphatidate cytidylyltransferase [Paracoccaceae bacterium]|nr:phosphatidate cytidylyltransferase [Paracoccaceae bacterium]